MGVDTKISWTDSSFNPWIGCCPVSEGCQFCYAERDSKRYGRDFRGKRTRTSEAYWRGPVKWNAQALDAGTRLRVFVGSWCDVLEDRHENRQDLEAIREDLWNLICETPRLDWLLLTKRAHRLTSIPPLVRERPNLHLGITAENQKRLDERLPLLVLAESAGFKFVSVEPQIGPVNLSSNLCDKIDWLITGGESGPSARPYDLGWARLLRAECDERGIYYFVKQVGRRPIVRDLAGEVCPVTAIHHHSGADPAEWPEDIRIREFPSSWGIHE